MGEAYLRSAENGHNKHIKNGSRLLVGVVSSLSPPEALKQTGCPGGVREMGDGVDRLQTPHHASAGAGPQQGQCPSCPKVRCNFQGENNAAKCSALVPTIC